MAVLTYDDMVDSVNNIARKYARGSSIDAEDLAQEIWVHLYSFPKLPETIEFARTMMINKAIDVTRKTWNNDNRNVVIDFHSTDSSESSDSNGSDDIFVMSNEAEDNHTESGYDIVESEIEVRKLIGELNDREKKYVVSKAYLTCGLEFLEDDFMEIIKDLSSEAKESLLNGQKGDSDDAILKLILGIKTGTNSGSIRSIKTSLRNKFRSVLNAAI